MNRIHKSIFNEQTGTYVAVSENTKAKGKSGRNVLAATALSTALGFGAMGSAQAQLVDACAGVSLPRSVVTDIVGDVLVPVVDPVQATVNGLLGPISTILNALPLVNAILPPTLSIDLTTILDNAADGKPITLQVLDANGEVVGATDACNLVADSVSLTDPAGIAIGGNKISGLGSDAAGAAAVSSAADFTSIAFGNFSEATESKAVAFGEAAKATAEGALALGAGAQASALNAIALGTDSIANEANTLSVGSVGNERKITNVADGTIKKDGTDAVTAGQLYTLQETVNALGGGASGSTLITQADADSPILVGAITGGEVVDFANTNKDSRILTGLSNGKVDEGSADAINGAQLYAGNKSIADALGGGAEVLADGTLKAPEYELTYGTPSLAGAKHGDVGSVLGELAGHVGANADKIAQNTTNITKLSTGEVGIVKQDAGTRNITVGADTDGTIVNFANKEGDARTLTGLANGELKTGSMDAVTGDQLFSTNTNLDSTLAALGGGAEVKADGTVQAPEYVLDDGTNKGMTTTFNNVGGALTNLDGRVTANTGDISNIRTDITNITKGSVGIVKQDATTRDITVGADTDGTVVNFAGKDATTGDAVNRKLTGLEEGDLSDSSTDAVTGKQLYATNEAVKDLGNTVQEHTTKLNQHTNQISTINQQLDNLNGNAVTYDAGSNKGVITLAGGSDGTTITNVKAGEISDVSTDAINGSQLYAGNKSIADALGGGAEVLADGTLKAPEYKFQNDANGNEVKFTTVGEALTNLDDRVVSNTSNITEIRNEITQIQQGGAGIVKYDQASETITVGSEVVATSVDFAGKDATGAAVDRKLTGVAAGTASNHAVNRQQLDSVAAALGGAKDANGNPTGVFKDDGTFTKPLYELNNVTNNGVSTTETTTVTGVGSALTHLNDSVVSLQNQVNSSIGLIQQPGTGDQTISIGGNTGGTVINIAGTDGDRQITGVAAGTAPNHAVNKQQLDNTAAALRGDIRRAEKRSEAGIAAATAVATLGQAYQPGQSAFSMGGGTWRGETGYAMGVSTVSENGKWLLKGAVSGSGRGGAGGGASVTYLW